MTDQAEGGRRFLKIFFAVTGVASFVALVLMVVTGMERVKMGGADPLRSAWLVEVNWLGFVVLLASVVACTLGAGLLHYQDWKILSRRT